MSFNKTNTLLKEVENVVNELPIGIRPKTKTDPDNLYSNHLLLVRSSRRIPSGHFTANPYDVAKPKASRLSDRLFMFQQIADNFAKC